MIDSPSAVSIDMDVGLVHPHEAWRTPSAFMTRETRRENGFSSGVEADLAPRLAPDVLIERMRMPDLRGDRFRAVCADGPQRCIRLGATRTALSWQGRVPALSAASAANSSGAGSMGQRPWAIPIHRTGIGRVRPSAGSAASRDHPDTWHESPSRVRAKHTCLETTRLAEIALRGCERAHTERTGDTPAAQTTGKSTNG
jgi:hypothetical protein